MRFDRQPRYEEFTWTDRKRRAAAQKPNRERAKLAKKYPLIADQMEVAPALSEDDELALRRLRAKSSEQSLRDLSAAQWRKGRAAYFACDKALRRHIRTEWLAWTGPAKPLYFIYVVEKHNGAATARKAAIRERNRKLRVRVFNELAAAESLPLF